MGMLRSTHQCKAAIEYFHLFLLKIRPETAVKHCNLKFNQWLSFEDYEQIRRVVDLKIYYRTHIGLEFETPYTSVKSFMIHHQILFCTKAIYIQPEDFLFEDTGGIMRVLPLQQQTNGGTMVLASISYGNDGSVRSFTKVVIKDCRQLLDLLARLDEEVDAVLRPHDEESFFFDPNMATDYNLGCKEDGVNNEDVLKGFVELKGMMDALGWRNPAVTRKQMDAILKLEKIVGMESGIIPDGHKPRKVAKLTVKGG